MKICKKCMLTEASAGDEFDGEGVCRLCAATEPSFRESPPAELKSQGLIDFEQTLARVKGKHKYDALLCLSGGKDSSYLADVLQKEYGLNLLAYNVQNGTRSPQSAANTKRVVKKLGLAFDQFVWPAEFSKAFFHYLFTHPLREGLTATVCRVCQFSLLSSAVCRAQQEDIPLVLIGYSPFQVSETFFYELTAETFSEEFRAAGALWDQLGIVQEMKPKFAFPTEKNLRNMPRILMPLHVLDCPSETEIRNRLQLTGLLKKRLTLPRRTMCEVQLLMAHCDTLHFGEPPFRDWISEKIRKGEANRLKYILGFKVFGWLCRLRLFRPALMRTTLKRLGLTEAQVLDGLKHAVESEASFHDIYKINPSRDVPDGARDEG